MKNYDKYIKALLLQLNQKGIEVVYETKCSYSEKFDSMNTELYLKFWHVVNDNEKKSIKSWCDTKKFKGVKKYVNIIDYLQKCLKGDDSNDE